ncbi:MAG: hypothetical protein L0387_39915 [Acidobacteria bacterium]|nr:hypothetical protein [Acidobacteriota bacterium]
MRDSWLSADGWVGLFLGLLFADITLQVVFRYGFAYSLFWTEDLAKILVMALAIAAILARRDPSQWTRIDLLEEGRPRVARVVRCLSFSAAILGCLLLGYANLRTAIRVGWVPIVGTPFPMRVMHGLLAAALCSAGCGMLYTGLRSINDSKR